MQQPIVRMEQVRFAYRRKPLLFRSVDLEIPPGSVVGLLGRNGAGKTTLLKLATGALFSMEGSIELFGRPAAGRGTSGLGRTVFVPEQFEVPAVTVRQYLDLQGGYYPSFDRDLAESCLDRLVVDRDAPFAELSFGQQKKVLLAFALSRAADLIILDEPTNGLDIPAKQVFRSLVAERAAEGRTVVISTHQVRDVENLIDRIVILEAGEILFQATLEAISGAVRVRRFESLEAAAEAGALAAHPDPPEVRGLLTDTSGDVAPEMIDLELLFAAALEYPEQLRRACGVAPCGDAG
ncbi:MAG: ABC transporter ATP-binding protein [Spirochaetaceae bacterium]|nr:MAG: ABC transporter ATP-binding protein [Spirochaetaceae bacterium]